MDERKVQKVLGITLLRLIAALPLDDVNELKAGGCADEVKALLEALHRVSVKWQRMGPVDKRALVQVQMRLNHMRAVLREG